MQSRCIFEVWCNQEPRYNAIATTTQPYSQPLRCTTAHDATPYVQPSWRDSARAQPCPPRLHAQHLDTICITRARGQPHARHGHTQETRTHAPTPRHQLNGNPDGNERTCTPTVRRTRQPTNIDPGRQPATRHLPTHEAHASHTRATYRRRT